MPKKTKEDYKKEPSKKMKEENLQKRISADIEAGLLYQCEGKWLEDSRLINQMIEGKKVGGPYNVNTFHNLRNLLVPSLYYEDPQITVTTNQDEIIKAGKQGERYVIPAQQVAQLKQDVMNSVFMKTKAGREFQKAISDSCVYGWSPIKTGISSKTDPDRETEDKAVFVSAVSPEELIYDPMGTGSFDNCAFVAHRMVKELDELDEDLRTEKGLVGQTLDDESIKGKLYKSIAQATKRKYVTIFEYHDQKKKKIHIVARDKNPKESSSVDNRDVILETKDGKSRHGRSHFTLLRFDSVNDKIRGISFLQTQKDLAKAINKSFSLSVKHMEMFGGLMLYEKGSLSSAQLAKWEDQQAGDMLEVEPNSLVNGRVRRESPLAMGGEYFASITMFHQLLDRELGIPDFQGLRSTKRKSATESAFEQSDTTIRRNYFLGFVKDAILDVADKLYNLVKEHYSLREVETLVGRPVDPVLWELDFNEDEFIADLDVMDMVAYNQSMAMGLMQALGVLSQNPITMPELAKLDGAKIAAKVFKGFGSNLKAFAKDPGVPHSENNPYEENAMAERGEVIPDPNPAENHPLHYELHAQKVLELQITGNQRGAQELMRHAMRHQQFHMMLNPQPAPQNPQAGLMAGGQGGNVPMNNPNAPAQPESQPEVTGNFVQG